jgi:hypothetical protein
MPRPANAAGIACEVSGGKGESVFEFVSRGASSHSLELRMRSSRRNKTALTVHIGSFVSRDHAEADKQATFPNRFWPWELRRAPARELGPDQR